MFQSLGWTSTNGVDFQQILSDFEFNQLPPTLFANNMKCAKEMVEDWMSKPNRKR